MDKFFYIVSRRGSSISVRMESEHATTAWPDSAIAWFYSLDEAEAFARDLVPGLVEE